MAGPRYACVRAVKAQLRRLEKLGRPVVAALNGTALGGGLRDSRWPATTGSRWTGRTPGSACPR
jgi:hypothetical protein